MPPPQLGLGLGLATLSKFGGAAAWTPANIATVAWYDADDVATITESGGFVSQWDDKSGNSRHVSNGSGSTQPQYNASDALFGGKPSIGYRGVRTFLTSAASFSAKNIYAAVTYNNASFGSWDLIAADPTDNNPRIGGWSTRDFFQDNGFERTYKDGDRTIDYSVKGNPTPPSMLPMLGNILTNESDTTHTNTWRLFSGKSNWAQWGRHGAIAELIMTDGTEDLATAQRIEGYLAWKWGVEANLPAGHPYKSSPPTI